MSELAIRPDRSENAMQAYDRFEIGGEALRRETGFDEDDKPEGDDLTEQMLKALVRTTPNLAAESLEELAGKTVFSAPAPAPPPGQAPDIPGNPPETAPPGTEKPPGPPGNGKAPAPKDQGPSAKQAATYKDPLANQMTKVIAQSKAMHAVRFSGTRPPVLMHPPLCADNAYGCPFTHAAEDAHLTRLATGTYECHLDPFGRITIGQPSPYIDTSDWVRTETKILSVKGRANGRVRA